MNNEIQFFATKQSDAFLSMANNIIKCYNQVSGEQLPTYKDVKDIWASESYKYKETTALNALIRKLNNIIFSVGDPLSVVVLLKNIANNKIQGLGHGGQYSKELSAEENKDVNYGKGHFRWDWKAHTLNETELKAIKMYLKLQYNDYETTEFKYKNLIISSKLVKSGVTFPNTKESGLHNQFYITIKNTDNESVTGFDYYGSTNDYNQGNTEIKGQDLLNAFECFISDAMAGEQDFEDFCSEFGYDSDSRTAERIHKECLKSLAKAQTILDADIYEFANELQETING